MTDRNLRIKIGVDGIETSAAQMKGMRATVAQVLRDIETPQERYTAAISRTNAAFEAGRITQGQYHRAIDTYKQELNAATTAQQASNSALQAFGGIIAGLSLTGLAKAYADVAVQADRVKAQIAASTGSMEAGVAGMAYASDIANRYGLELYATAGAYGKLTAAAKGTALEGDSTRAVFEAVAKASGALSLSADETSGALLAIGQMMSKGKVSAEELRGQLGERLPGAFNIAAKAMGMTTAELDKYMADGNLMADDFLPKFARALNAAYGAPLDNAALNITKLGNAWTELKTQLVDSGWVNDIAKGLTERINLLSDFADRMGINNSGGRKYGPEVFNYMERLQNLTTPKPAAPYGGPAVDEEALAKRLTDIELRLSDDIQDARQAAIEAEKKAAEERLNIARAEIKSKYDLRRADYDNQKAIADSEFAANAQAAKGNADELLAIKRRQIEAEETFRRLSLQATIAQLTEEKALTQDRAGQIDIAGQIQAAENGITASLAVQEAKLKGLTLETQALTDTRLQQLDALANAAERSQKITAAAQNVLIGGGTLEQARSAADAIQRQLDLEEKIYQAREKQATNQTKDLAEQYVRQQASAEQRLQALTQPTDAAKQATDAAKVWEDAWQQATRRVDDTFRNLWADVFNGSKSVMDSLKTTFLDMLAEMAHAAITRPLVVSILGAMGAPTGTANAESSGGLAGVAGSAFSSAIGQGVSKALGGLFGGSGSAAMGTLGTVGGGAAIGAFLPALLGIKGGSAAANLALPVAGGIGGAVLGSTVVAPAASAAAFSAMGGVAGGGTAATAASTAASLAVPIVGAIGAIVMALLTTLIKKAPPKATAELTLGQNNALTVNSTSQSGGGSAAQLVGLGGYFGGATAGIERALGVEVGAYGIGFNRRGRDLTLAGSADGSSFYNQKIGGAFDKKGRVNEAAVQEAFDAFMGAMLKRQKVLKQVDDELTKGAIRTSDTLTQISGKLQTVAKIRGFEDQSGGLSTTLDALLADYQNYEQKVRKFASKAARGAELTKLAEAFGRQFEAQARTLRGNVAQAAGGSAALGDQLAGVMEQFDQFRAQDAALRKTAAKSKGKISYAGITADEFNQQEAAAIRKTVTAYFSAAGAGIDDAMKSVKASVQSIVDSIAGPEATLTRVSADIASGMTALSMTFDAAAAASKAADITALIQQRYAIEAQAIQDQLSAAKSLKDLTKSLTYSDLSPLSFADQFSKARTAYETDAAKFNAGDSSAAVLTALNTDAQQYLSLAKQGYGTGNATYQSIYTGVLDVLNRAGSATNEDATAKLKKLQDDTNAMLGKLKDVLDNLAKQTTDQVIQQQATATGSQVANSLAPYLDNNSVIVQKLIDIKKNTASLK